MTRKAQDNVWPLPKFYFTVKFGSQDNKALFQEISGLETENQVIEYKHGDSNQFATIKMPEVTRSGNVTLKKGVFIKGNNFFKWFDAIKKNTVKKETVTIQLLDEKDNPKMTWTLLNAWPTKISSTDMKSDANEIAIETLELAHEGLKLLQMHEM